MALTDRRGWTRRRQPTIPIVTRRALERAPTPQPPPPRPTPSPRLAPPPPPVYTPTPGDRVRQMARQMEHGAYSETVGALERQRAEWDAERKARLEAMAAMQESRAAESERAADYHQSHLNTLAESFAPNRADAVTVQALAFNPRYHDLPASELWDMARREEGQRNAIEFGRTLSKMSPQEQETLGPLAAGLHKEDMDSRIFQEILAETRRGGKGVYGYSPADRRKANRVLRGLVDVGDRDLVPEEMDEPPKSPPPAGVSPRRAPSPIATPEPRLDLRPEEPGPTLLGGLKTAGGRLPDVGYEAGRAAVAGPLQLFEEEYKAVSPHTRPFIEPVVEPVARAISTVGLLQEPGGLPPELGGKDRPERQAAIEASTEALTTLGAGLAVPSTILPGTGVIGWTGKGAKAAKAARIAGTAARVAETAEEVAPAVARATVPQGLSPTIVKRIDKIADEGADALTTYIDRPRIQPKARAYAESLRSLIEDTEGTVARELAPPTTKPGRGAKAVEAVPEQEPTRAQIQDAIDELDTVLADKALPPAKANKLESIRIRLLNKLKEFGSEEGALRIGRTDPAEIERHVQIGLKNAVRFGDDLPLGSSYMLPDGRIASKPEVPGGAGTAIHVRLARELGLGDSGIYKVDDIEGGTNEALDMGLVRIANQTDLPEPTIALDANSRNAISQAAATIVRANPELADTTTFYRIATSTKELEPGQSTLEELAEGVFRTTPEGVAPPSAMRKPETPAGQKAVLEETKESGLTALWKEMRREGGQLQLGPKPKNRKVQGRSVVDSADDAVLDAEQYIPPVRGAAPGVAPSATKDLPPLHEYNELAHAAGTARQTTLETANSQASAMYEAAKGLLDPVGLSAKALKKTNGDIAHLVKPKKPGLSTNWRHVVEHPENYDMSQKLTSAMFAYKKILLVPTRELFRVGIIKKLDENYVRRLVEAIDGKEVRIGIRKTPGAKQGFTRPRTRELVDVDDRVKYFNDPAATAEIYHKEAMRQVADAEFVRDAQIKQVTRTTSERVPTHFGKDVKKAFSTQKKIETEVKTHRATLSAAKKVHQQKLVDKETGLLADAQERLVAAQETTKDARASAAQARKALGKPGPGERYINAPLAGGRFTDEDYAQVIERSLQIPTHDPLEASARTIERFNQVLKPLWATIDFSYMALQTLASALVNPAGWAKMNYYVLRSLIDPQSYYGYAARKRTLIQDMIADGAPWNGGTDILYDLRNAIRKPSVVAPGREKLGYKFAAVERAIHSRGPFKIGNDAWNRALNIISTELYSMHRPIIDNVGESIYSKAAVTAFDFIPGIATQATARKQLGRTIAHMTGRLSVPESAKLGTAQKHLIGALPFAGRYWLAHGKLLASLTRSGLEGNLARRAVAGWLGIGVGLYALTAWATGQEINLDPRKTGKFLTLEFGGVKAGVGGPLQQVMVLLGKIAKDPEKAHDIVAKFARGKASPLVTILTDIITQETFMGDELNIKSMDDMLSYAGSKLLPFGGQEAAQVGLEKLIEGEPGQAKEDVLHELKAVPAATTGLRSFPESAFDERNDTAQEMFDNDYKDLDPEHKRLVDKALSGTTTRRIEERSDSTVQDVLDKDVADLQKAEALVRDGRMSQEEFKEFVKGQDIKKRAIFDQMDLDQQDRPTGNRNDPMVRSRQILWDYAAIFRRYPNADFDLDSRNDMFDELDRFRGALNPQEEEQLDTNLGANRADVPLVGELRDAKRNLVNSGFFDLHDEAWTEVLERFSQEDLPDDRNNFERELLVYFKGQGLGDMEAASKVGHNRYLRIEGLYYDRLRRRWEREYPELVGLAFDWGYSEASRRAIGAQRRAGIENP